MEIAKNCRAYVYIDGCNLYHGMRETKLRRFYWLDLAGLGTSFLKEGQSLLTTKYFTARIRGDRVKSERHSVYIDALNADGRVQVIEGAYQLEPFYCGRCQNRRPVPKEKQTDTNIATEMVADAFCGLWDTAFLVSGDSDLAPPIRRIKKQFPNLRILVAFPPARFSDELARAADNSFRINQSMLNQNQLPNAVQSGTVTLTRPEYWRECV